MNRGEVRDFARFLLDDKPGTLISDGDLNVLIGIGIDKVAGEVRKLKEDYFVKSSTFSTANGTRIYDFSVIATDLDQVRFIEDESAPYARLRRLDWMKHKFEFSTDQKPRFFYVINRRLYLGPVPDGAYGFQVYYDQAISYPASDSDAIPLIPAKFHDMVGIWAALIAKQHLNHYEKQAAGLQIVAEMLNERKADMAFELTGNRTDEVEIMAGLLGKEASRR